MFFIKSHEEKFHILLKKYKVPFRHTEAALFYGRNACKQKIDDLLVTHKTLKADLENLMLKDKVANNHFGRLATVKQLVREAIEAYEERSGEKVL